MRTSLSRASGSAAQTCGRGQGHHHQEARPHDCKDGARQRAAGGGVLEQCPPGQIRATHSEQSFLLFLLDNVIQFALGEPACHVVAAVHHLLEKDLCLDVSF